MKKALLLITVAIILFQIAFAQSPGRVVPQVTPQISGCSPELELIAPAQIKLTKDEPTVVEAKVKSLRCIVSHVSLVILNYANDSYKVTPAFYNSILPNKSAIFNITFSPIFTKQVYIGKYLIKTNEGGFEKDTVEIIPAALPLPAIVEKEQPGVLPAKETVTPVVEEPEIEPAPVKKSQLAQIIADIPLSLLILLIIIVLGVLYFALKTHQHRAT